MLFGTLAAVLVVAAAQLRAESIPARFQRAVQAVSESPPVEPEPPVLSGTEGFDIAAYRASFGETGTVPVPEIQTAQSVVDGLSGTATGAARLTSFEIGFATLEYNWFAATVSGNAELSESIAAEVAELRRLHPTALALVVNPSELSPFASLFYTRAEAGQMAMVLRQMAGARAFDQHLPKEIDPEGYLSARMRAVHSRLTNSAELILAAADAYAIYY
ncbi:MAG: hypothetical protein OXN89_12380 [Bryobacterales bacterium]|nr:hypothetical protein [Bryobacterales bacterium]